MAEVSKALQSVRSLVRAGHLVVFSAGEDGQSHHVLIRISGKVNIVRGDGTNCMLGMYIVPRNKSGFPRPVHAP